MSEKQLVGGDPYSHSATPSVPAILRRPPAPPVISFEDKCRMADAFAKAGIFGAKTQAQALSLILIAEAEGIHPGQAVMEFDIIDGKPVRKAARCAARFIESGGRIEWQEMTDTCARAKFTHPLGSEVVIEWTIEMAQRVVASSRNGEVRLADKDVWKNYPRAMLRARVQSEGPMACYPGYALVTMSSEEAIDIGPATVIEDDDEEADDAPTPGLYRPRPTDLEGSGFLSGARKRDAVQLMTQALERAAAVGIEALDEQFALDAPARKRLSQNAAYGLEEVHAQMRYRLLHPKEDAPPPPTPGADESVAPPSSDDGDPFTSIADPATPAQERQRIDAFVSAMHDYATLEDYDAWARGQFTLEVLSQFSPEGRAELKREHQIRRAALHDAQTQGPTK